MDVAEMLKGDFFKADDLRASGPRTLKIAEVKKEMVGQGAEAEEKPVVYFIGSDQKLVLNKTNTRKLAELFGGTTDEWQGAEVELFQTQTQMSGKEIDCVRVRAPGTGKDPF